MKPAIRLAAIQELPVKYVLTHDSFRVGEDGPTHQPIEQEAQMRLMEKVKNHKGHQSLLALRPADAIETSVAWDMALKNTTTPTALNSFETKHRRTFLLYLQDTKKQPKPKKGGYLVKSTPNADITLFANGSEVSTLIGAAEILEKENNLKVNVASIISEGLFKQQSAAYQESVIPKGKLVFGLTARTSSKLGRIDWRQRKSGWIGSFWLFSSCQRFGSKIRIQP